MLPRTNYEMTDADFNILIESMKPTPAMLIGGSAGPSQQEKVNAAWAALGGKMGFDSMTVRPASGKGGRFFTAVPNETPEAQAQRLARESVEKINAEIETIKAAIYRYKKRLCELNDCKGIEITPGVFSGCTGIGGDCPICGN